LLKEELRPWPLRLLVGLQLSFKCSGTHLECINCRLLFDLEMRGGSLSVVAAEDVARLGKSSLNVLSRRVDLTEFGVHFVQLTHRRLKR
jgi:hypothetical protein